MTNTTSYALVALLLASDRRAELSQALLAHRDPWSLVQRPEWAPTPEVWRRARQALLALHAAKVTVIPVWELPPLLARSASVPPALFVRGDARLLTEPAICIVGARAASAGPRAWAFELAHRAAKAGRLVVSGGARGIDAAAHEGALSGGGRTVVYLGVAADRVHPVHHKLLFERVLNHGGALVSEHPPGAVTPAFTHALRNRFIAAHAEVLCVAEAKVASGSLGTAAYAKRLGTPIIVPGPEVGGEREGIQALLDSGDARVVSEPRDVELSAKVR